MSELCTNIILHSNALPGDGYGVLSGQVEIGKATPDSKYFSFCISDLGRGIPSSILRTKEAENIISEAKRVFYDHSEPTIIVRETLSGRLSGRPDFPSNIYKIGDRGLRIVSKAVGPDGTFCII